MAYSNELWKQAKTKCRLNAEEIEIAKRHNINPRSLIKNIPSKSQPWKAPVGQWLRELDSKAQKKSAQKQKRRERVNSRNSNQNHSQNR